MGNQVWFYLQDGVSDTQIAETNQRITEALKSYPGPKEGENPVLQYGFMSSQDLDDWVTDINTNPKSPQAHLKPATHASLRQMFGMYATPGAMAIDTAYTRCPEDLARILADVLVQEPLLARISSNGRDFLQKAGYGDDHPLARLIEPRVVPVLNTNRREPPQSGVATFRGINDSFVCMLYGKWRTTRPFGIRPPIPRKRIQGSVQIVEISQDSRRPCGTPSFGDQHSGSRDHPTIVDQ